MMQSSGLPSLPVVGIGASAGGIRALQELFEALPADSGAAFVVIVHLAPDHVSELPRILSAHTSMRVVQVSEPMRLEADTVYVIAPDRQLVILDGYISDADFQVRRGLRAPIDMFFRSQAEQHGDGYAVVLTGGGSDGSVGVRSIREKGGIVLVQDPREAEFPSMPRNAVASGADFVLPVREIAAKLVHLLQTRKNLEVLPGGGDEGVGLKRILALLQARTGQDFSRYKTATLLRRLTRRMQIASAEKLDDYLVFLRSQPEEARALFEDLLISVTCFFRDPAAFETLASEVIAKLIDREVCDGTVRVWVPGCATGEEAYSIAMLLTEAAERARALVDIQVFATDLDASALARAREGRYPAAIAADVTEERLQRHFIREENAYVVRRELRDRVVFALHGVIKDPPFSRLDLVSCRNLLIYFDREAQQQAIGIFHYALRPGGYLFLGAAEGVNTPAGMFSQIDRDARIYLRNASSSGHLPAVTHASSSPLSRLPIHTHHAREPVFVETHPQTHAQALEAHAPPSMLVDASHQVIHLSENAGRYLLHPVGPVSKNASEIVRPELMLNLQSALDNALERKQPSLTQAVPVQFDGAQRLVVLHVSLVLLSDRPNGALVVFLEGGSVEAEDKEASGEASDPVIGPMRTELFYVRNLLRTTREQYEGAIEELRAANEEMQSINEEYRSTAEELETSKEELQSINEELQTVNHELKTKVDMVSRAHSDLQNLISATAVGTLFLDNSLRIKLLTPRVSDIFRITQKDEGRSIADFTHRLDYDGLISDMRRLLTDHVPIERMVRSESDRWYLVRLRPYRTTDDVLDGVVATFVDVTERRLADVKEARQSLQLGELSHRVKNSLAVVLAITRLSLKATGADPNAVNGLEARLQALAKSHDLLLRNDWKGASLEALAREQLGPYLEGDTDRFHIDGMPTILPSEMATPIGLVIHELATNAAKHGALKYATGRVNLTWKNRREDDGSNWLDLTWAEHGVPAVVAPAKTGAGTTLIENGISGAEVTFDWQPHGLCVTVEIPMLDVGAERPS